MSTTRKILITALLILLLPGMLLAAEWKLPKFYADTYYAQLPAMVQRLADTEERKLVLVGGSNVAFGVDTGLLEAALAEYGHPYAVCPMGLYAAVGSSAMLDLTQRYLRDGDIVVLSIEPMAETMSTYFGATAYWKCAESSPQLLFQLDKTKSAALAGSCIPYLQERWAIFRSGIYPKAEGAYAKSSFDASCNMVYPRNGNTMTLGFDPSAPIDLTSLTISEEFARQVNDFCEAAAKKGASVYWTFCPMNRSAVTDASPLAVEQFFRQCSETFSCPIISNPNHYILDSGWFFDSNFHLNTAGAQLRTQLLAVDLLTELGCYQAIPFESPSMPPSMAADMPEQTGDDAFLFLPTANGEGWLVSGLTETDAAALTVPSVHDGLPVVGFTADALSRAGDLEELRLHASILSLPDNLFAGCPSLTRLILEHTDAPCPITAHTLDGADQLRIFVPQSAYHFYRDGFGCQKNLWAAYLDRIFTF